MSNNEIEFTLTAEDRAGPKIGDLANRMVKELLAANHKLVEDYRRLAASGKASSEELKKAYDNMMRGVAENERLIDQSIKRVARETEISTSVMNKAWGKVKGTWEGIKASWAGITAALTAVYFLKNWAQDALEAEAAFNKLKIQIENLGAPYENVKGSVEVAIKATSEYARVQEEDVAKTLQQLIFYTGDFLKSQENLNLAYDLAYQKGISVSEAAEMIGRGMTGNLEMLGRVMPEFRNLDEALGSLATEQEKTAYFWAVIKEKVEGASSKMTEHEKYIRDAANRWKDFTQEVGGAVIVIGDYLVRAFNIGASSILYLIAGVHTLTGAVYKLLGWTDKAKESDEKKTISLKASADLMGKAVGDINNLTTATKKLGEQTKRTGKEVAEGIKEGSNAREEDTKKLKEQIKSEEERLNNLKDDLKQAIDAYVEYGKQVEQLEKERANITQSAEDKIRDLKRATMSSDEAYNDRKRQAEESLSKYREALASGDLESAKQFAQKAMQIYEGLSSEVKDGDRVIITQADAVKTAIDGIKQAEQGLLDVNQRQRQEAEAARKTQQQAITELVTKIGELTQKIEGLKDIEMKLNVNDTEAWAKINELKKDTSSTHTIYVKTVETKASGGFIVAQTGRFFPGYGGGDRIPILGEAGEYMNRKEAVKFWGVGLFDALNKMDIGLVARSLGVQKLQEGGISKYPATDNRVYNNQKTFNPSVNINSSFSGMSPRAIAKVMMKEMKKIQYLS